MSNVDRTFADRRHRLDAAKSLATGGGGGHPPDMEALIRRVDQLEVDVRDAKASLGRVEASTARIEAAVVKFGDALVKTREDVAELKGRIGQLPTTIQLVGFVLAVLGIAGLAKFFSL